MIYLLTCQLQNSALRAESTCVSIGPRIQNIDRNILSMRPRFIRPIQISEKFYVLVLESGQEITRKKSAHRSVPIICVLGNSKVRIVLEGVSIIIGRAKKLNIRGCINGFVRSVGHRLSVSIAVKKASVLTGQTWITSIGAWLRITFGYVSRVTTSTTWNMDSGLNSTLSECMQQPSASVTN